MKRILIGLVSACVVLGGGAYGGAAPRVVAPGEGCAAANPASPTCTFTVTSDTEQQGGAVGTGSWQVIIKRGKTKSTLNSSSTYGEPSDVSFSYVAGDKVTVKALSPGAVVVAGTVY